MKEAMKYVPVSAWLMKRSDEQCSGGQVVLRRDVEKFFSGPVLRKRSDRRFIFYSSLQEEGCEDGRSSCWQWSSILASLRKQSQLLQ
jgi:hypothetical protein